MRFTVAIRNHPCLGAGDTQCLFLCALSRSSSAGRSLGCLSGRAPEPLGLPPLFCYNCFRLWGPSIDSGRSPQFIVCIHHHIVVPVLRLAPRCEHAETKYKYLFFLGSSFPWNNFACLCSPSSSVASRALIFSFLAWHCRSPATVCVEIEIRSALPSISTSVPIGTIVCEWL